MKKRVLYTGLLTLGIVGSVLSTAQAGDGNHLYYQKKGIIEIDGKADFDIEYDRNGKVTRVKPDNRFARVMMKDIKGYKGKQAQTVVLEVVKKMRAKNMLHENPRVKKVEIDIEEGSYVPTKNFFSRLLGSARKYLSRFKTFVKTDEDIVIIGNRAVEIDDEVEFDD
ncbi:MAG: hypothetical protein Q4A42_06670 [Tissierellia bacterium]|nr:hypothetical protein [Tissierellia bacterium]